MTAPLTEDEIDAEVAILDRMERGDPPRTDAEAASYRSYERLFEDVRNLPPLPLPAGWEDRVRAGIRRAIGTVDGQRQAIPTIIDDEGGAVYGHVETTRDRPAERAAIDEIGQRRAHRECIQPPQGLDRPTVLRRAEVAEVVDLVGPATRAAAKLLARLVHDEPDVPVLAVTPAPFGTGVVIHITARLSPAAVDRLVALAAGLDR